MVRGIDHVGITVPDLDEATRFFEGALGCELVYRNEHTGGSPDRTLGASPGSQIAGIRLLRCATGANIELFAFAAPDQRTEPPRPSDLAIQHVAFYVDDIDAALERARVHGAIVLSEPQPLPGPEAGPGNRFVYARAPWGMTFELITHPDPMPYEQTTDARRWTPPPADSTN